MDSTQYEEQGRALVEAGRAEEALALLREGLKRFPLDEDLMVGCAFIHSKLGEYAEARAILEPICDKRPDFGDAFVGLVEAYLAMGRVGEASKWARRAAEARDADGPFLEAVGRRFYDRRLYGLAAAIYHDAIERFSYPPSMLGYGSCLHMQGNFEAAEKWIRAALAADPHYWEAYNYLGNLVFDRDPEEARKLFARIPLDAVRDPRTIAKMIELCGPDDGPRRRMLESLRP